MKMTETTLERLRRLWPASLALAALGLAIAGPAPADDRNLLRTSSAEPYVFVLFDVTYSMTTDLDGVRSARFDDGTDSKIFLAKEALDVVLQGTKGVRFGFATFPNFSQLRAIQKSCANACIGPAFSGRADTNTNNVWCTGWENNGDDTQDAFGGYSVLWPTTVNPSGLSVADVVPLDWKDRNVDRIRKRLAPNLALGETVPNFGVARYFRDTPRSGETYLRLRDEKARPFFAWGNTPLEGALRSFRHWYADWRPVARQQDPEFAAGCRKVFVVLLTDGFETCGGNAVNAATDLLNNLGVKTFVIGFAVNNPALDAIAIAGGTDSDPADPTVAAYPADDQQALISAFNDIIKNIQAQSRTFASAAVPSVSASAGKQIYLSSFSPVDKLSVWPGRLDAYVKPVPFTATPDGRTVPDRKRTCSGSVTSGCRVWSAEEQLLTQAPTPTDTAARSYKIGNGVDQRRVYYARQRVADEVPAARRPFLPPTAKADRADLYGPAGMGFDPASTTFADDGEAVIAETLVQKEATIEDPITRVDTPIKYVLGDVFHSDPVLLGSPNDFRYFAADMAGRTEPCGPRVDGRPDTRLPYPCFAESQRYRRRLLLAGSNDGQLHAFDAGTPFKFFGADGSLQVDFTPGTGKEVFSFVPRSVLPALRRFAGGGGQELTVDGRLTVADVLVDPRHDGTPDPTLRQWRSVVVAGLREGGRGYYALDLTQPDAPDSDGVPTSTSFVPSCIDGAADCKMDSPIAGIGPFPPLPFPLTLWELVDTWDEDGNGAADLGFTWSRPDVGRIRVIENGEEVDKYVAVFGGGMDPDFKRRPFGDDGEPSPRAGNYLYMVDVETGKIIYKRRLDLVDGIVWPAMAPSAPAAVDTDSDSYLDTIYLGTTAGHLFKVDLRKPQELAEIEVPDFSTPDPATGLPPIKRKAVRVASSEWEPFPIFSTGGRPIYYPPSVIFVSALNRFALGFGTGDREDLWSETRQRGRFYLFVDGGFTAATPNLPFTEGKLKRISLSDQDTSNDFLLGVPFDADQGSGSNPGWALELEEEERVVDKSFSLAGVVFFNSYIPEPVVPGEEACGRAGESRLFTVAATNANGLRPRSDGNTDRYRAVADFVTSPFVEVSQTTDDLPADTTKPPNPDGDPCTGMEQLTQSMQATLFPANCRFANYTVNVKTIRSDSGIECVAPVPVCIVERNWKEF